MFFWSILCFIGGGSWLAFEITRAIVRHRRKQVIRESRYFQQGREIRSSHDCWEIEGRRVR